MNGKQERGVAMIKAMLVVALATTIAVSMVSRQQFDIRRTGNMMQAGQAGLYADGVDEWAAQVLRRDNEDNQVDHTNEDWATILPPIPVEGGTVGGYIEDLQGRFNLNSLVAGGQHDKRALERFRRLLVALELEPELAVVVADWIDADIDVSYPAGAEDDSYMGIEQPYRSANGPMLSPTELLLLKGVGRETFQKLQPHVTALPVETKVNVNTATEYVLMSLAKGLSSDDVDALIEGRGDEGYPDVDTFIKHDALAGRQLDADTFTVHSNYFLLVSQVQFGALSQQRYSVLKRYANGGSRILMRAQGQY